MSTLIKLCFSNIWAKKFRSFLIVLSVALSTALIYAILALSATTTDYFENMMTQTIGGTDFSATPGENSSEYYIDDLHDFNTSQTDNIEFIVPIISGSGYHNDDDVLSAISLTGASLEDFSKVYDLNYIEKAEGSFEGNTIIIGKETAENLELTIGDTYLVTVAGQDIDFKVWAIIEDNNILSYNINLVRLLTPVNTVEGFLGITDKASFYFIGLIDEAKSQESLLALQEAYPNLTIEKAVDSDNISFMLQMIQIPLALMGLSVLLVSCFIIFSSFKIIIIERMPFIGTIRSLGSPKKAARRILFMEKIGRAHV